MAKVETLDIGSDMRLLEWLTSNPVGEVYSMSAPVMIVSWATTRQTKHGDTVPHENGIRRWPIVPAAWRCYGE